MLTGQVDIEDLRCYAPASMVCRGRGILLGGVYVVHVSVVWSKNSK